MRVEISAHIHLTVYVMVLVYVVAAHGGMTIKNRNLSERVCVHIISSYCFEEMHNRSTKIVLNFKLPFLLCNLREKGCTHSLYCVTL